MKKDVIYIDIEDDITSIIEKIKGASSKIVALVPPKRTGALQSAVNLKLLQKAAGGVDKRVVLITNDQSLIALAAGVKIPVAKNLQSRPEMASVASMSRDENDVINGEDMAIGDLARTSATSAAIAGTEPSSINKAAQEAGTGLSAPMAAGTASGQPKAKPANGFKGKIPNFDTFRKKLFLGGGLSILLISFLVWAFIFAPQATVTITANTRAVNIDHELTLDPGLATDVAVDRISAEVKQIKKTTSTEFDTTGTKEIGERATTTLELSNGNGQQVSIPAGTIFTAEGMDFATDSAVVVEGATVCQRHIVCPGAATVSATATAIGPEYNIPAQAYSSDTDVDAMGKAATGGSKETVSVVTAEDVEKAKQQLENPDVNEVKSELSKQFDGNVVIIKESFKAEPARPSITPAVGEQAKRARLSVETTYTLVAMERKDIDEVLAAILKEEMDNDPTRRVYSNGNKTLRFNKFRSTDNGTYMVELSTTGYTGPKIDEENLKQQITGKRHGEIEQLVNNINGVENVDIKFSQVWVRKAPKPEKITIQFSVKNNVD